MKTVLVAVLDWGLGHATRCVPVINELRKQHATVLLAGNGKSLLLLKREFPMLPTYDLPGYAIQYPERGSMAWAMIKQWPRLSRIINEEHEQITALVKQAHVDVIISDNRYGCYDQSISSIMIGHQLSLQMPRGFAWLAPLINTWHNTYLKQFDQIWIPDEPTGTTSLSGRLSFTRLNNAKRIGILSRLSNTHENNKMGNRYDVVALISGPEPQRTQFEVAVAKQLKDIKSRALMVCGKPDESMARTDGNLDVVSHLTIQELQAILSHADVVIARSGYSTIMDLSALGKHAILVPTPGQTEQEYLAEYLRAHGWAYVQRQSELNIVKAWQAVRLMSTMPRIVPHSNLSQTIAALLC